MTGPSICLKKLEVCYISACRYQNSPYKELSIAAIEQMKITEIRLRQVLQQPSPNQNVEKIERRTGQTHAHLGEMPCSTRLGHQATVTILQAGHPDCHSRVSLRALSLFIGVLHEVSELSVPKLVSRLV